MNILEIGSQKQRPENWTVLNLPEFDATVTPYNFPDEPVDVIYSEHFIEHLNRDEGIEYFRECFRILKPNGLLRTAWPSMDFVDEMNSWPPDHPHFKEYVEYWEMVCSDYRKHGQRWHEPKEWLSDKENTIDDVLYLGGQHVHLWYVDDMIKTLRSLGYKYTNMVETHESMFEDMANVEDFRSPLRARETSIVEAVKVPQNNRMRIEICG